MGLIEAHPKIMLGKPVIAGTRIAVELVLERLASGETEQDLLDEYSRLTRDGIRAALAFGASALHSDVIYPPVDEAA